MSDLDVCSHGRPDHQEWVPMLRAALGMYPRPATLSPQEAFGECLDEIRRFKRYVRELEDKLAAVGLR